MIKVIKNQFYRNLSAGRHYVELSFSDEETVGDVTVYMIKVEGAAW